MSKCDIFMSLRFIEARSQAEAVKKSLEERGLNVYLCSVPNSEDILLDIANALQQCRMAIVFGTKTYGEKTNDLFSTFQEMTNIIQLKKPFYLIKMCDDFTHNHTRMVLGPSTACFEWKDHQQAIPPKEMIGNIFEHYMGISLSSLKDEITRNVIVIGKSGVGKSTIVNMLFNDDCSQQACKSPAKVGNQSSAQTKETTLYVSLKTKLLLLDTIGLSDRNLGDVEIIQKCKAFLKASQIGVNTVVVVMSMQRIKGNSELAEDRANMLLLDSLFEKRWKEQAVLVLTNYEDEFCKTKEDIDKVVRKWIGNDTQEIQDFVLSFPKIILTDNFVKEKEVDIKEDENLNFRQNCLQELKLAIFSSGCSYMINPAAGTLWETILAILRKYFAIFRGTNPYSNVQDIMRVAPADYLFTVGICCLCRNPMTMNNFIKTNCNHAFHSTCFVPHISSVVRCPECQKPVDKYYSTVAKKV